MRAPEAADLALRNPITGISACCARSSGIAAAPPSKLVNLRRLIVSPEAQIRASAMVLPIMVSSGWFSELTFAHP